MSTAPLSLTDRKDATVDGEDVQAIAPADAARRAPVRVLVADDHDINQLLMTAMLRRLGCDVDIANDGAEALALIAHARGGGQAYRFVLMDVQMPVLDGLAATRRLRDSGVSAHELPVVALTGNADPRTIEECMAAGMQAHLAKPATLAEMDATLARWVGEPAREFAPRASPAVSAAIQQRYAQRRDETVAAVAALDRADAASCRHTAELLHKLAGTAAMLGEAALGDAACALEYALTHRTPDGTPAHLDAAVALFTRIAAGTRAVVAG